MWLRENGHWCLLLYLTITPERFSHIKRLNKEAESAENNVKIAEIMAKENGGILPGWMERLRDGYYNLSSAMYLNPEMFSHIPQEGDE